MPPLLALILCSGFVIFLLRLDHKLSPQVTRALWIPTIWMLYVCSKPIGVWFQAAAESPDAGSLMDQVFLLALMLGAILVLVRRNGDVATAMKENKILIVLFAFMLISIIWSEIPVTSFKRWIREFQAILMSLVIFVDTSPRQALEVLLRRTVYILIPFSLLLIKYFPAYGVEYGRWSGEQYWIGVAQQKNGLGLLCVIAAAFLIWSLLKSRVPDESPRPRVSQTADLFLLGLTLYLFGGPRHSFFYSATSTYALLAGGLVSAWIYFRRKTGRTVSSGSISAVLIAMMIVGVASVLFGGTLIRFLASSAGRDATLTGRTGVWTSLLPSLMSNPVLGRGFGGFWTSATRDYYQISGAHSGYLDVLLGVGFLGLMAVSLFVWASGRRAHRELSSDFYWGLLWVGFLIICVVHNIGESSVDTFTSPLTAILLFFAICSPKGLRTAGDRAPGPSQ